MEEVRIEGEGVGDAVPDVDDVVLSAFDSVDDNDNLDAVVGVGVGGSEEV